MSALMNQARSRVPRIAEAAVERARLTVVPRTPVRAARVPFVVLVSLLLVAGVAGLLCFNTSMQQASFTATAMEQQAARLDAKQQSLNMELDALRNPQRVAVRAQRMGMVAPDSPAFIRLADGKVLGKPKPATADNALRVTPLPTRKPKNLRPTPVVIEAKPSVVHGAARAAAAAKAGTKKSHKHKHKHNRHQGSQR
jgi:ABC-type nickel/cobalt efflux system permease component RcnA